MEHLWAPWRLSYVTSAGSQPPPAQDACFFCAGLADTEDRKHLIAQRTEHCVVVLNRFPYNSGHLLVAPKAHQAHLADLSRDELLDSQETLRRLIAVLDTTLKPDGYNVGVNLGRVAGAGLPGHLHWHLVPRWNGDTNFMPVVGGTKVLVQALDALYDLLAPHLRPAP